MDKSSLGVADIRSPYIDNEIYRWPLINLMVINALTACFYAKELFQSVDDPNSLTLFFQSAVMCTLGFALLGMNIQGRLKHLFFQGGIFSFLLGLVLASVLLFLSPGFASVTLLISAFSILCVYWQKKLRHDLTVYLSMYIAFSGLLIYSYNCFDLDFLPLFSHLMNQSLSQLVFGYSLILFAIALASNSLQAGPLSFLKGNTMGSKYAKRLILTSIFAPTLADLALHFAEKFGILNESTQDSLSLIFVVSILMFAIILTLKALHREEVIRLASEQEIRELHGKYQHLIDTAPDPIFSVGTKGELKFVNAQALKMLGYEKEELVGKSVDVLIPDSLVSYYQGFLGHFKFHPSRITLGMEQNLMIKRKNGSLLPVEVSINPCVEGKTHSATCIVRDLSLQKEMLRKIEESQTKLNLVLENLPLGIWFTDEKGKVVFGNKAGYKIWGLRVSPASSEFLELKGRLKDDSEVSLIGDSTQDLPDSKEPLLNRVVRVVTKDGKKKTLSNSIVPVLDKSGNIFGKISVNEDITQDVLREERIELINRFSKRLNEVSDDIPAAKQLVESVVPDFADWCAVSFFDGKRFSPAAYLHRDAHKSKALEDVVLGNHDYKWRLLEMSRALQSDEALLYATVDRTRYADLDITPDYLQKLQTLGTTSYIMCPISDKNEPIGVAFFGIVENTFGRKYTEDDLKFAKDLCKLFGLSLTKSRLFRKVNAAVKAREEILAVVAHDIKGPISTMLLAAEMIDKAVAKSDACELARKYTKISQASGGRTLKLIQDILDFSKIDAGTFSVRKTRTRIRDFLEPVFQEYAFQLESRSIRFSRNTDLDGLELYCDKDRIIQVISNILSNALKFTPAGGSIALSVEKLDGEVEISVRDSGSGVSPEIVEKMFDKFWQKKETASLGSGLGLSICKGIVQAHSGKIWAESDFGKGCTVRFRIPSGEQSGEAIHLPVAQKFAAS